MIVRLPGLLGLLFLIACSLSTAQSVSYLHTFALGSNGSASVKATGSEDDLDDLQRSLVRRLGLRPKSQLSIKPSRSPDFSAFRLFGSLYSSVDSSDFVVGAFLGAWQASDRPELATLVGLSPDSITADYILHLTMFFPSHNAVVFVVAADGFEFPRNSLNGFATGIQGGGKYLITIRSRETAGYSSLLDRFSDLLDSNWDEVRNDENRDGNLSVSEWLSAFGRRAAGLGLTGSIVRVAEGRDMVLRQLRAQ
jgi:hypothetical protein